MKSLEFDLVPQRRGHEPGSEQAFEPGLPRSRLPHCGHAVERSRHPISVTTSTEGFTSIYRKAAFPSPSAVGVTLFDKGLSDRGTGSRVAALMTRISRFNASYVVLPQSLCTGGSSW